ncbi:unnamed protein product [Rhizophagus irregularis]|nr:unnamed protein product [Rhizophagus irregularis]
MLSFKLLNMNDIQNFFHINYDENDNENDVNKASDIDDEPDDSFLKEIYTGQTFTMFEVLEICLKRYAEKMDFEIKIVRCEKEDSSWARKSYKCHHGEFSPALCKIPDNIMEEIQFYVQECHLGATVLKRILRNKYPNQDIYNQDLYSAICRFKSNAQIKNDAATLIEYLKKLHEEDSECRIVATAVVCDETVSTYKWILEQTMRATGDLQPAIIFTDADPTMQVAISNKYSRTIVRHCAFHIRQNLVKKIKRKLNIKWDDFIREFYILRNSLVIADFKNRWAELMVKYPEVQKYCERVLYPTKTCWAYGFTKRSFLANTHSTQRVESMNRVIKMEANLGSSLCQLHSGIELRLKDEAKYSRLQEFRNMNPTTGIPQVSNTIFKSVDKICKKYLTPNSLALQQKQMVEALLYRTWIKETSNIDENWYSTGFMEDDYEEPQILLDMALKDCSNSIVKEIWEVKHIQSKTNRLQFVILLDDGTHYFPSRQYSEEGLMIAEKVFEKSVQIIENEYQLKQTGTFLMINTIHGQDVYSGSVKHLDSKKEQYGHGLGLCKKALNLAIENKSIQTFKEILQQFINNVQVNTMQNRDQHNDIYSEAEVCNIANSLQHKGKGRPTNKRYLSAIENYSNKNRDVQEKTSVGRKRNERQCSICKSWYHDSRNCSKKNECSKENV